MDEQIKLQKSYEELSKDVKKFKDEIIATNYELKKQNADLSKLVDDYNRLSKIKNLGILTEEDSEEFDRVREKIVDFNSSLSETKKLFDDDTPPKTTEA